MARGINIPLTFTTRCQRYYQIPNKAIKRGKEISEAININIKNVNNENFGW